MNRFVPGLLLFTLLASAVFAQSSGSKSDVREFRCHEIDRRPYPAVPVRNGIRMRVVVYGSRSTPEGQRFPVAVEIVKPGMGPIYSGRVSGTEEDVMFRFAGSNSKGRLSGLIFLDELNETSIRVHVDGKRYKAYMDCE